LQIEIFILACYIIAQWRLDCFFSLDVIFWGTVN